MNIDKKTVLITGANRGIGQALVSEALRRGATRVDAGPRGPLHPPDTRVTALMLDVTSVSQIQEAVDQVDTLDVLINNAGIALYDDLSDLEVIEQHLAVNLLGLLRVTHAFLPLLKRSHGSIVNNVSLAGLAPLPVTAARGIFDGLEKGEDDIFPDPVSLSIADAWRAGAAKALERQFAAFVQRSAA